MMIGRNRLARKLGLTHPLTVINMPSIPRAALEALKAVYPVRLMRPGEDVDSYRHYCGAAQLVQDLDEAMKADHPDDNGKYEEDLDIEEVAQQFEDFKKQDFT